MREERGNERERYGRAEIPFHLIYGNTVSPPTRLAASTRKAAQCEDGGRRISGEK